MLKFCSLARRACSGLCLNFARQGRPAKPHRAIAGLVVLSNQRRLLIFGTQVSPPFLFMYLSIYLFYLSIYLCLTLSFLSLIVLQVIYPVFYTFSSGFGYSDTRMHPPSHPPTPFFLTLFSYHLSVSYTLFLTSNCILSIYLSIYLSITGYLSVI